MALPQLAVAVSPVPKRELDQHNQHVLADLFRQGQQREEIRTDLEPLQLAELFTATYLLTTLNWLDGWFEGDERLEPRLSRALDVFLTGATGPTRVKRSARQRMRGRTSQAR